MSQPEQRSRVVRDPHNRRHLRAPPRQAPGNLDAGVAVGFTIDSKLPLVSGGILVAGKEPGGFDQTGGLL